MAKQQFIPRILSRWERLEYETFAIYVVRQFKTVLVGSCALRVARKIHGETIKTINYDSHTIFLFPESPFGR